MINILAITLLFVAADTAATHIFSHAWDSKNMNIFSILLFSAFLSYGIGIKFLKNSRTFIVFESKFKTKFNKLYFWLRISHIIALIFLPIMLLVLYIKTGGRGNDLFIALLFFLTPILTLFMIIQAASEKRIPHTSSIPRKIGLILFFWSFAFLDILFTKSGQYLSSILHETTNLKGISFLLLIIFRLFFLWSIVIPMRLWTQDPDNSPRQTAFHFIAISITVTVNGFF